jgi:predicted RNase H-like HicB family nuclease
MWYHSRNGRDLQHGVVQNDGLSRNGGQTMRQVIIYPGEDGYWVAECPTLPGCISQGKTKEEAIWNIREAIEGYIAALEEDGLPVPEEQFSLLTVAV